jgi:hypothetical protein
MKTLFDLPNDILSKIYDYDGTYREIFKKQIAKEIWYKSWRVWSRNYSRTKFCIEEEKSIYRFTMPHFLRHLWAYWQTYMIYCNDISVSIVYCNTIYRNGKHSGYYSIYMSHDGSTIYKWRVFTIEQFMNFQGNNFHDGYVEIFKEDDKILLEYSWEYDLS